MDVGKLSEQVAADVASLYEGMRQAADVVSRSAKEMERQFEALEARMAHEG
jgi:hypothetical protein